MLFEKRSGTRPLLLVALAALAASLPAQAASILPDSFSLQEAVQARFDPAVRHTRVSGRVAADLCFVFNLPQEWRVTAQNPEARLNAGSSGAELTVKVRSAHELRDLPQSDLASRDAAFLQRDYEELLGRPAQSVSLSSSASGITRWSATWIDANLPTASHAMTIETFIAPLSKEWVLELSLTNVETEDSYSDFIDALLTGLRAQSRASC